MSDALLSVINHPFVWIYILNNYFRNKYIAYKEELAVV